MLTTVLNIVMFEDCRNQWSMSRPLLALILLNEEVHNFAVSTALYTMLQKQPLIILS